MKALAAIILAISVAGCYDDTPRKKCLQWDVQYVPRPKIDIPDGSISVGGGIELTPQYYCRKWEEPKAR